MSGEAHEQEIPRGIRNNNPGNIRAISGVNFLGQLGEDEKGFCTFAKPEYGIRAMAVIFTTYRHRDHCKSVKDFVQRWAPPNENNTAGYLSNICRFTNMQPGDYVDIDRDMTNMVRAFIEEECGQDWVLKLPISLGVAMAKSI